MYCGAFSRIEMTFNKDLLYRGGGKLERVLLSC
jgi:hypothetical protein